MQSQAIKEGQDQLLLHGEEGKSAKCQFLGGTPRPYSDLAPPLTHPVEVQDKFDPDTTCRNQHASRKLKMSEMWIRLRDSFIYTEYYSKH